MSKPYTAYLLWHAEHAPTWELVTTHPWFESALEAGLFANCLSTPAPEHLVLDRDGLFLVLSDGRLVPLPPESLEARQLRAGAEDLDLATDSDYEPADAALPSLADQGLAGPWSPVACHIEGPAGPLETTIELDATGNITGVEVTPVAAEDAEVAPPVLVVLPRT